MKVSQDQIKLTVTEDAKEALQEQGLTDIPDVVTLEHREATVREVRRFEQAQKANEGTAKVEWVGELLHRRVIGDVPKEVVVEAVIDLKSSQIACLIAAFLYGELPDEKKMSAATRTMMSGLVVKMANLPSSAFLPLPDISMGSQGKK